MEKSPGPSRWRGRRPKGESEAPVAPFGRLGPLLASSLSTPRYHLRARSFVPIFCVLATDDPGRRRPVKRGGRSPRPRGGGGHYDWLDEPALGAFETGWARPSLDRAGGGVIQMRRQGDHRSPAAPSSHHQASQPGSRRRPCCRRRVARHGRQRFRHAQCSGPVQALDVGRRRHWPRPHERACRPTPTQRPGRLGPA